MNVIKNFHLLPRLSGLNRSADFYRGLRNERTFTMQKRLFASVGSQTDAPPQIIHDNVAKPAVSPRIRKISQAMKAYLERAQAHEKFLSEKNAEFEIGKRHLANMMGVEYENFTQNDINKAIEYLMPSGLYDKKARPMMKPPEELYPKEKAAQFEASGRPYNCFFYTRKCNFFATMHEIRHKFLELDAFEDKMLRRGINAPPEESALFLGASAWLEMEETRKIFLENINDIQYRLLIDTLNRLCAHPYAFRCKDFISKFRKVFEEAVQLETIPNLIQDESGRRYITAESKRKHAEAKVTVYDNGQGNININGYDIKFFTSLQDREQVMAPLLFTGLLKQVDVDATIKGHGHSVQAGAIRHAIALCLRSFVSPDEVERMRLAGFLTRDIRRRERKKPGQKGARAKYKWLKR